MVLNSTVQAYIGPRAEQNGLKVSALSDSLDTTDIECKAA